MSEGVELFTLKGVDFTLFKTNSEPVVVLGLFPDVGPLCSCSNEDFQKEEPFFSQKKKKSILFCNSEIESVRLNFFSFTWFSKLSAKDESMFSREPLILAGEHIYISFRKFSNSFIEYN